MLVIGAGTSRKQGAFEKYMLKSPLRRRLGGSMLNRILDRREFKRRGTMGF